jgi:hypothetical protein
MASSNPSRSQAILRVPVDIVDAVLIFPNGERADVVLFVPPDEDVARFVCDGPTFMPIARAGEELLVARAAIGCLGVAADRAPQLDHELPVDEQQVRVTLRGGAVIEGLLRWVALDGRRRTSDGLNADSPYLLLHADPTTYLVMKAHIATVSEL